MPIRLLCPNCRQPLTIADHLAGKRINCPKCKNQVAVPTPDGSPSPAPSPRPAPAAPQAPADEDDLSLNIPGQDHTRHNETEPHKRCPGCGRDLPESTVLCTGCGHDFKTGQRRKGFEMADPDKKKRIFETVLRNGFFLIILAVALGGIYYAYKNGLFSSERWKGEETKKPEEPAPAPPPPPAPKPAAVEVKGSLLVVVNNRFGKINVFVDRDKIGEVAYRETKKFPVAPTGEGKSANVSFEAILPASTKLADSVATALNKGTLFSGTTQQGMRITVCGPGPDMVPQVNELLPGVMVNLEVIKDSATGVGMVTSLKYKDCTIKPVSPQSKIHLGYGEKNGKTTMKWIVQECLVERSGAKAFDPAGVPLESVVVKLAVKDGQLDVAE